MRTTMTCRQTRFQVELLETRQAAGNLFCLNPASTTAWFGHVTGTLLADSGANRHGLSLLHSPRDPQTGNPICDPLGDYNLSLPNVPNRWTPSVTNLGDKRHSDDATFAETPPVSARRVQAVPPETVNSMQSLSLREFAGVSSPSIAIAPSALALTSNFIYPSPPSTARHIASLHQPRVTQSPRTHCSGPPEAVGAWQVSAAPVSATLISGKDEPWYWLNVEDTPVTLSEAFTGFCLIDDGYYFPDGNIVEFTYEAGALVNQPGMDLVLFHPETGAYAPTFATDYDGFATWQVHR